MRRNLTSIAFCTNLTKVVRLAIVPIVFLMTTALPSLSATASEQSCNFVNSFLDSKPEAIQALKEIFGYNEQVFQTISGAVNALPDKFDDGLVVEIANVGGLFVEHFIVMNTQEIGSIYFRLVYEKSGEVMVGVKFAFNSDVEAILEDWPVFQDPADINC